MRKQGTIFLTIALIGLFTLNCPAQRVQSPDSKINRVYRDSISLGNYVAVLYEIFNKEGDQKLNEEISIYRDGKIAASAYSPEVSLYNFAQGDKKAKPVYMKDINKDGYNEVIIIGRMGEGNCCYHAGLHRLKPSKFEDITRFDLKQTKDLYLEDIDKDSIPEIVFADANFAEWHAPLEKSPMPVLIWKWQDNDYRIANYKFADYLAKKLKKDDLAKLSQAMKKSVSEYKADDMYKKYPSPLLWSYMLDYIYANKQAKADSIFNDYWPKEIPGKDAFYYEFKKHLEDGFYWEGLQKSDF